MGDLFPKIKKSIASLIEDEEGGITGKRLLFLGTMVVILGSLFSTTAFAGHRSHSSHSSHSSHRSGSYHRSHTSHSSHSSHQNGHGSHSSHASNSHSNHSSSHGNHSNHSSHSSHSSHSNTSTHSNSRYSSEGDVTYAPSVSQITGVAEAPIRNNTGFGNVPTTLPSISSPEVTPISDIPLKTAIPLATPKTDFNINELNDPGMTKTIE